MAPAGHDLHRHTALKNLTVLKAVDLRLLGGGQLLPESVILLLIHRAVYIIICALVIAGAHPRIIHIHTFGRHQRRRRIKKVEVAVRAQQRLQLFRQCIGSQRTGGNDDLSLRNVRHLAGDYRDIGMAANFLRNQLGKAVAVHRQSTAGLHTGRIGTLENETVQPPQFFFQKAHGIFQRSAPQRVGAAKLREIFRCMGGRHFFRLHFTKPHLYSPLGQLPRAFTAGKSRADHCYLHLQSPLFHSCGKPVTPRPPQFFSLSFSLLFSLRQFWQRLSWQLSFSPQASSLPLRPLPFSPPFFLRRPSFQRPWRQTSSPSFS